jgi:SSS family solute:Na+ symporter
VAFILSLVFSVGILGAQMVAFGKIINSMMPEIDYTLAVIIGGSIVILYSTAGGLLAVVHTDLYQFIILMAGFLFTVIMMLPEFFANSTEIFASLPENFLQIDGGKGTVFLLSTFLAFLFGETFAPGYATRFCVGKNAKEITKGIFRAGAFLLLTFPVILFFISVYAKYSFPDIDPEAALPQTILKMHSPVVSGLIIAALMSAVMSSADSILNSTTAIFTKDLYEQYLAKSGVAPKKGLRIARISSIILGLLGISLALVLPNIIDLLLITYSFWAPCIILPVIVGVFYKVKNESINKRIFITMVITIVSTIIYMIMFADTTLQPTVFGVIVSVVVYFITSFFIKTVSLKGMD